MKGELKNCSYCHKVYLDFGEGCCSECKGKQEVQRQMVRDYMFSHGATDLISISHGTGLPLRTIMRMRKEGFLAPRQQTGVRKCRECGVAISEGIYCLPGSGQIWLPAGCGTVCAAAVGESGGRRTVNFWWMLLPSMGL